jgi:hypothetical protein
MGFHARHVNDRNHAEEAHSDSRWMGFHACHVNDRNHAEEAHSDSRPGWDFMHAMSVIEIRLRRRTATHDLDGISCTPCQ